MYALYKVIGKRRILLGYFPDHVTAAIAIEDDIRTFDDCATYEMVKEDGDG